VYHDQEAEKVCSHGALGLEGRCTVSGVVQGAAALIRGRHRDSGTQRRTGTHNS